MKRVCFQVAALVCFAVLGAGIARADSSWPRLPNDTEIDAARTRLIQDRTFVNPACAVVAQTECAGLDGVALMTCRARLCMDACRLGPEVRKSELTEVELIKAHQPLDRNPPTSAYVFALTTTRITTDNCRGRISDEVVYGIEMLAYRDAAWVWSSNRLGQAVRQQDPGSKTQRDAEFASYFLPQRLVLGFPEVAGAAADPFRLTVRASDPAHPLRLRIYVEQLRPSGGPVRDPNSVDYMPASEVIVSVGATSYAGNEGRLALHLESPNCSNCTIRSINGHDTQALENWRQPVLLKTDRDGYATVEFFLDFAALMASRELSPAAGLQVPFLIAVRTTEPGQPERVRKEVRFEAKLGGVGVVEAVQFQPSRALDGERMVPLDEYLGDPGTPDGERRLAGKDRVTVKRYGAAQILAPGSAPGATMTSGHQLQVGDLITVNACGTDTRELVNGLPFGSPAQIWVTVRFFDGLRGSFGVNAKVCRSALMIGKSWSETGFKSLGEKFLYRTAEQGVEAAIEWLFSPAKVVNLTTKLIGWVRSGLGYEATYVALNSAVTAEWSPDGHLLVTTREGDPRVITSSTNEDGIAVPVGTTATIVGSQVSVATTDPERAVRADAWLAKLAATSAVRPGGGDIGKHTPWTAIAAGAAAIGVLLVWFGRRRTRKNVRP